MMRVGARVAGRFALEAVTAYGGMGVVYRARDELTGAPVAVKAIVGMQRDLARRFETEARVLAALSHPAIVRYVAHGTTESGEPYLAMEWLEGEDLASRLERGGLTLAESVRVVCQVAGGLAAGHARDIIHRDVKPSNIFLCGGDVERVKVLDFGVARALSGDAATRTATGVMLGTPSYMAPEQAFGDQPLEASADVFSLGCVLFECCAGRRAFRGEHPMAIVAKIALEEPPRLGEFRSDVPPALEDLVARMLAKEASARPPDGLAVVRELEAIGLVASSARVERASDPRAITGAELRMASIVIARRDEPGADPVRSEIEPLVASIGARFGARVGVLFQGSVVVAALSGAGVATDQAAKAASCALAIRDAISGARMALVTGRAVLAENIVGNAIERAVELLPDSSPGDAVLIDDVTAGLLDYRFDVREAKGRLALFGERDVVESTRTLLGKATACFGRDRDLTALEATLRECVDEPVTRIVLVTAGAGMGKSRLRYEFVGKARQAHPRLQIWTARGDSRTASSSFAMIAPNLRRTAGILDGEPVDTKRRKLLARVARSVDEAECQRVAEFLGEMTGVKFSDESIALRAARESPPLMADQVRRAWLDFLAAECRAGPLLVVLDDLQWADLPSVEYVGAAVEKLSEAPFMVLALARPEVRESLPRLWSTLDVNEIRLGPLTRRASEALARAALGDRVDDGALARIVERASGNAFYLEELIRAVAEGRADALPDTVLGMMQARLESLEPEARRVLRAAGVFGTTFWLGGLRALLGRDQTSLSVGKWLDVLVDQELVSQRGAGRFAGAAGAPRDDAVEYVFRQASLREAAYAMLTPADRTLGHLLAGTWLERVGEPDELVLAEHFREAGATERARTWFARAAQHALNSNNLDAAIACAKKGAHGATGDELASLLLVQAEAHTWRGEFADTLSCATRSMEAAEPGSSTWEVAAGELAEAAGRLGNREMLEQLARQQLATLPTPSIRAERAVACARLAAQLFRRTYYAPANAIMAALVQHRDRFAVDEPRVAAWIDYGSSIQALLDGDFARYVRHHEALARGREQVGDQRNACLQRVRVGYAWALLGAYERAIEALRSALSAARTFGLPAAVALAQHNLGIALGRGATRPHDVARLREARDIEQAAALAYRAQGDGRLSAASLIYLSEIELSLGDLAAAEASAQLAIDLDSERPTGVMNAQAALAAVNLERGRFDEALTAALSARRLLDSLGQVEEGEVFIRLIHARALAATGHADDARAEIRALDARVVEMAAKISDPELRGCFLENDVYVRQARELSHRSSG